MKKIVRIAFLALIHMCIVSMPIFATEATTLPSGIEFSQIAKTIDSYVAENEKTNAGLSVAIFSEDNILYEGYHGYADKENQITVDKNTVMEWGSATKILVWVSAMQLVEEGKLSLTTDITEYLPEGFLTKLQYDTPLTMYNLMHHTAGWQETLIELMRAKEKKSSTLEATLRQSEPHQIFEPEEFTAYSNWGVALAGYIVEQISGQPFHEYVHENIFAPLKMNHTALNADLSDNPWVKEQRKSLKYYLATGEILGSPHFYYIYLYPAGMATGTLTDFLHFAMALIPDETGKSPLFKEAKTLKEFLATSHYYENGKTPRNSHGLWAGSYKVSTIGHG